LCAALTLKVVTQCNECKYSERDWGTN
jgi:hypothetical protein